MDERPLEEAMWADEAKQGCRYFHSMEKRILSHLDSTLHTSSWSTSGLWYVAATGALQE